MTDRERVEALLRREKLDRIPIFPFAGGFTVLSSGTPIADFYNNPEVSFVAQRKAAQEFGWIFIPMFIYAAYGGWEFGGDIKWPSGKFAQAPTVTRHPVETEEDVCKLKKPDVSTAGFVPLQTEFFKLSAQERFDNEPFNVLGAVLGPFSIAGNICGPEKLCKWLLKKPEAAHRLVRLATDHMLDLAQYWHDMFGIDGVLPFTGEATAANQLISAKQFEQFVLPYMKEAHEKIFSLGYKHIFCHICGEQNENLSYWAQIPMGDPGMVSVGHEIDLDTVAKYFPNDIAVGNLEPAIVQSGTPEEVYEAARKVIEKGKKIVGGYIFAPGCELPPFAPKENVRAMIRAVNDFGWYD